MTPERLVAMGLAATIVIVAVACLALLLMR